MILITTVNIRMKKKKKRITCNFGPNLKKKFRNKISLLLKMNQARLKYLTEL